jgi:hypothetical protein
MVTSVSIRPESVMFFFYVLAAYSFIHWIDNQSIKYYMLVFISTALTLLCKISAINIGIFFILIILINKGWKFLLKPNVILLGVLCIIPSILWYSYSHRFYLLYGNSLGLSNEYAWIGWDFFTNPYFIIGIIRQELIHVWTFSGPLIVFLALITTKIIKKQTIIFPLCWLISVGIFYLITSRTTADSWASSYHIFSIPSVSMLLGISVIEIYDKHFPLMKLRNKPSIDNSSYMRSRLIITGLFLLVSFYAGYSLKYLDWKNSTLFEPAKFYACRNSLSDVIPQGSLILVSGGSCTDNDNYPVAYNSSYFFYWLDRKGYNICNEEQSLENIINFKEKGAEFFVAETSEMKKVQGFEEIMKNRFNIMLECDGIILFKL